MLLIKSLYLSRLPFLISLYLSSPSVQLPQVLFLQNFQLTLPVSGKQRLCLSLLMMYVPLILLFVLRPDFLLRAQVPVKLSAEETALLQGSPLKVLILRTSHKTESVRLPAATT